MSADPQSTLSQLWQTFGAGVGVGVGVGGVGASESNATNAASALNGSANNTAGAPTKSDASAIAGKPDESSAMQSAVTANQHKGSNGNNNYVDFNQFIMQHNFLGQNNLPNGVIGYNVPQYQNGVGNSSYIGNGGNYGNMENSYFNLTQTSPNDTSNGADHYQAVNVFNPNSNLFPSSDSNTNSSPYPNGMMAYNMCNQSSYYDTTAYGSPYGSSPHFIVNPFATGFNFNLSTLQASAPEFVPRFGNLSLNENGAAAPVATTATIANQQNSIFTATITATTQTTSSPNPFNPEPINKAATTMNTTTSTSVSTASSSSPSITSSAAENSIIKSDNAEVNGKSANMRNGAAATSGIATPKSRLVDSSNASSLDGPFFPAAASSSSSRPPSANGGVNGGATSKQSLQSSSTNGYSVGSGDKVTATFPPMASRVEQRDRDQRDNRYEKGRRNNRDRERDYFLRYDHNKRSNKRRDDWNRNRDRINGFRVEEKYSTENGKDSPIPSPEKKLSPKKVYPENEKLSQREKLVRDIEMRRLECLVCVEHIKSHHSVWSCQNCYHILHLQCIVKWASSSKADGGWRCPACQNVLNEVPRDYYCFCGKQKNPQYNRQEIAHSCGDVCGRIENCTHSCTLLCHPGPCPPCQANVKRECGCGKTTKTMQCCLKEAFQCEAKCDKLLNCEVHHCEANCHAGKCAPCDKKVQQQCHCSKQEREVACTRDTHDKHLYSCGKPCGKDLLCGNHKCKDCCHAGECRPCKLSPNVITTCPCGKMPMPADLRSSCLDPIPVCEGVCGKTLRCGKAAHPHHCTSKCHLGNCPPCNKQTAVKCRCGHMDQLIKCRQLSSRADDARCKKRCTKKRSCGKHKCNQECCIDIDHICPLPCNYTLSCGKHKCDMPCHRGNCPPCYRSSFDELFCECGAEVIYPPVPCGTKRPVCKRPCSRSHPCEHPPQHNCHSAPTCPPCMIFTNKWCFGHHEQRKTIPCSQESFSCGLPCNKPLPCGRHKCIKPCHEGNCQSAGEICKQSCNTLRAACGHKCMVACHDGECPETQCKEMVEVQCECGNRKQMRTCHELAREYSRIATAQLASSMAEMQRGNYMELSEILAPVKMHKTNKTLDCNDECRLVERNRRLAIGLQIRNPDLPQKIMTKYSDFIRNFAKRDAALVKSIHDALTKLVKLAKESKQKSRSHSFPVMNREKRQLVHEMCEMFGVESVAYDAEPNRNVVATAYRDRSWLPATSIMEVMQRESGQRRVPVPSNNAWGNRR